MKKIVILIAIIIIITINTGIIIFDHLRQEDNFILTKPHPEYLVDFANMPNQVSDKQLAYFLDE